MELLLYIVSRCLYCLYHIICSFYVVDCEGLCLAGYFCPPGSISRTATVCPSGSCMRTFVFVSRLFILVFFCFSVISQVISVKPEVLVWFCHEVYLSRLIHSLLLYISRYQPRSVALNPPLLLRRGPALVSTVPLDFIVRPTPLA